MVLLSAQGEQVFLAFLGNFLELIPRKLELQGSKQDT